MHIKINDIAAAIYLNHNRKASFTHKFHSFLQRHSIEIFCQLKAFQISMANYMRIQIMIWPNPTQQQ